MPTMLNDETADVANRNHIACFRAAYTAWPYDFEAVFLAFHCSA